MLTYERYQALRAINIHVPGEPGNEASLALYPGYHILNFGKGWEVRINPQGGSLMMLASGIKICDWWKIVLDHLILSKLLIS